MKAKPKFPYLDVVEWLEKLFDARIWIKVHEDTFGGQVRHYFPSSPEYDAVCGYVVALIDRGEIDAKEVEAAHQAWLNGEGPFAEPAISSARMKAKPKKNTTSS